VWRRHLAAEAGRALLPAATGWDERVADRRAAVGFIDISGYTRLSRHLDLADVAVLLERFETVVGDTVIAHGGRVIKNLGDEVLFVTEDPASAAEITLGLLEQIDTNPDLPPVHAGLAFGPVLYRSGDVFGPVVNIAARIASLARQGTIRPTPRWPRRSPTAPSSLLPPARRGASAGTCNCAPTGCAEPSPRCSPTPPHDGGRRRGGVNPAELVPEAVDVVAVAVRESATVATTSLR